MAGGARNRPLRILHIDPERNWGGGEVQVLGLLDYLSRQGHHSDLLAHPKGRLFEQANRLGIRSLPLVARNDFDLRAVSAIRKLIRAQHYDVVHLHTRRAHALAIWLPRGPKYVVTRRIDKPEPENWYTRHLYRRVVDGIVAISAAVFDQIVRAGANPEAIRLIPSGVDALRFRPPGGRQPAGGRLIAGTAAVLEPRKGHRFLLEAARVLKDQGRSPKWRLAGDGSARAELERLTAELGLREDVEFLGYTTDIPGFLAGLDIFVLPSLAEGLGVAVLEAMAAGKPVVASRVGGLIDSVVDGVTGFLVPPGDGPALARAIATLASDPALRDAMGTRGAERVEREFTMDAMARRNEAYYYELTGVDC